MVQGCIYIHDVKKKKVLLKEKKNEEHVSKGISPY